jgi:hypothetical protein
MGIYLFMAYLTTLPVALTVQQQVIDWLVNIELEEMKKEAVMV